jgi:hypothetical protein
MEILMKSPYRLIGASLLVMNLVGCASITTDANQMVQITTADQQNNIVNDAECVLKNKRGEWHVRETPGTAQVHKSDDNMLVTCKKDGLEEGSGTLISRSNSGFWGNILFGGGIGMIIDHNKGTAYTYPTWVKVIMGKALAFDRKEQKEEKVVLGTELTEDDLAEIEKEKEEFEKQEIAKAQAAAETKNN